MGEIVNLGRHVKGFLQSADASAGAEIPLFKEEENTGGAQPAADAVDSDEYLTVVSVSLVTVAGGDCVVFHDNDNDNALDSGEEIIRGTFAANGGITRTFASPFGRRGQAGAKPHVIAPAGVVTVELEGYIRKKLTKSGPV